MKHVNNFLRDERGAVMVMVTLAIVIIFGFSVLVIDIGMMTVVKTQLQNAADAAVLAGISALALANDSTLAITRAKDFASGNRAIVNAGAQPYNTLDSVMITDADITFPDARTIRVTTHRTQATGDGVRTYFMRVIDPAIIMSDIIARAAASLFWVCGVDCMKPWAPPDRWFDADTSNTFNPDPLTNPLEYYDPILTGYTDADLGNQITLKVGNVNQGDFGMEWYFAVDFPPLNKGTPITGGSQYRDWIAGCTDPTILVEPGDSLQIEPGNMVGPTNHGLAVLLGLDPGAMWNAATGEIVNSAFVVSPRIIKTALFDPDLGVRTDLNGRKFLVIAKVMVLFIESLGPQGEVTGRFIRLNAPGGVVCEDQTQPTFLFKTALIE